MRKKTAITDPDLQIRWGAGGGERSSRPWDKGGGVVAKNFFPPFGPKFGLKIRGEPGSLGPLPCIRHLTATCPNNFNWDYNLKSIINKERFRNTFIKGKRQFETRDQVFLLLFSFAVYDIYTQKFYVGFIHYNYIFTQLFTADHFV